MTSYFIKINGLFIGNVIGKSYNLINSDGAISSRIVINDKDDNIIAVFRYKDIIIEKSQQRALEDDYDIKIKL